MRLSAGDSDAATDAHTASAAASAVILHGGKILFVRSTRTGERWAFPGGKSEQGETPEATARREAMEEVGLEIELTGRLGVFVVGQGDGRFEITCFAASAAGSSLVIDPVE